MSPAQAQQFDEFWRVYPRKVGKLAAAREWERKRPNLDDVLAALAWQTQMWADLGFLADPVKRLVPHPRTWICQGRWLDEAPPPKVDNSDWFSECQRAHNGRCNGRRQHEIQRQLDALRK